MMRMLQGFVVLGMSIFLLSSPSLAEVGKSSSFSKQGYFTPAPSHASKKVSFRWPWEKKPKKKCHCCRLVFDHGKTVTNCTYTCKCDDGKATCTKRPECTSAENASRASDDALKAAQAAVQAAERARQAAQNTINALQRLKQQLQSATGANRTRIQQQYDALKRLLASQIAAYNSLRRTALAKIQAANTAHSTAKYWDSKCPRKCSYSKCLGPNICQITQALTWNAAKFEIDMKTVQNTAKRNQFEIDMKMPAF